MKVGIIGAGAVGSGYCGNSPMLLFRSQTLWEAK
jgi:hypothetical protein